MQLTKPGIFLQSGRKGGEGRGAFLAKMSNYATRQPMLDKDSVMHGPFWEISPPLTKKNLKQGPDSHLPDIIGILPRLRP